jgi:hypothetical protein
MRFLLLLLLICCTMGARFNINSNDLLQIPQGIQGDFKVATIPSRVEAVLFNGLPSIQNTLWSSWGNGCLASNGKYYTTIGDHRGTEGKSYVYEYDPAKQTLTRIVNIAEVISQKPGQYGHGKIHSGMHEHKGSLYFATYWGKQKEVPAAYASGYKGSLLFRYDLRSRKTENLGAIAPKKGLPGSALDPERELLYFYGVEGERGEVVVYDLKKRSVRFQGGAESTTDHRVFMMTKQGKVYFSDPNGRLSFYDPDKNVISATSLILPGPRGRLRAAAQATSSGIIYGMTRSGRLFAFHSAKQAIKDLGPNFLGGDYTAVMVLSPDEKYLYFAPGAHGSAVKSGTPIVQYEIKTGRRKVIAFLLQSLIKEAGYFIAGNYNMQIDAKGAVLYCTFNGSKQIPGKDSVEFGLPAVVVIHIPQSERT